MHKGDLQSRGIMYQDSDCYVIRQSMPYPLRDNNVFLIESGDGWVVIDIGVDLESTRRVWELAIKEIGISFKHIKRIYITHCHPDHMGAARWLQQCCEAPVFMLREEIERAEKYVYLDENNFLELYRQAIEQEIKQSGFPEDKTFELINDWYKEVRPLYLKPAEIFPLDAGDKIELHGADFEIMRASGHSDGQCMFWCSQLGHLFLADVLAAGAYLHFTDWPNSELANPLGDLFYLLARLNNMKVIRAFPGHGPLIGDLENQLEILTRKHQKVLKWVESAVEKPVSAGDFYSKLYNLGDYVHVHRVVMGETLGYLNYLVSEQRLRRSCERETDIYLPVE